jgi:hypothetical protein
MPYRPEPAPPGAISPSIMLAISTAPPSGVYESWDELTAPVDVNVVAAAKVADCGTPNRASVPSVAAPTACGTVPWWAIWTALTARTLPSARIAMMIAIARPCRLSATIRPNARGSANEIANSRKISIQLVQVVGFSNGWALLAL